MLRASIWRTGRLPRSRARAVAFANTRRGSPRRLGVSLLLTTRWQTASCSVTPCATDDVGAAQASPHARIYGRQRRLCHNVADNRLSSDRRVMIGLSEPHVGAHITIHPGRHRRPVNLSPSSLASRCPNAAVIRIDLDNGVSFHPPSSLHSSQLVPTWRCHDAHVGRRSIIRVFFQDQMAYRKRLKAGLGVGISHSESFAIGWKRECALP
jgi:hypothetical protein